MTRSWLLALACCATIVAETSAEKAANILRQNCLACHGAAMQMSKLDLRSRESILAGGEHGPVVEPFNPEKSRLYRFVAGLENPSMPPGKKLPDEQIAALRAWIEDGAPMPVAKVSASKEDEEAKAALAKMEDRPISAEERQYWAFRAPVRPVVPTVVAANPIDAFLRQAMQSKRVKPSPPTDKRTLIRRAYLDMTGLPPTIDQVNAFVNDSSPKAFSKVVEDLLASPHYGERWGRHWLDVVRYADSGGFEYDRDRPTAWQYRDYVIRSFNQDKPYDRFVKEQIAGDEIWPDSADARTGVGYLRLGLENNLKNEQTRLDELDDLVTTTSNAFLAVTVGCARCHNHKFDPIPQKDYYRIQAVFFPAKPLEYPLVSAEDVAKFKEEQKRIDGLQAPWKDKIKQLEQPYRDRLMAEKKAKLPDYIQLALRTPPSKRTEGQKLNANQVDKTLSIEAKELYAAFSQEDKTRHDELTAKVKELERERPDPYPSAMSVTEPGRDATPSYFLHRGSPGQKGSAMKPGVLAVASRSDLSLPEPPADATTSWRRQGSQNGLPRPRTH